MGEAAAILLECFGGILFMWVLIVRMQRAQGKRTARLAVFAHIAGAVIWLPMAALIVMIESWGADSIAGWTWKRAVAAVWFWLMMSFMVAAGLVENAKHGRRGLFGFLGKNVL